VVGRSIRLPGVYVVRREHSVLRKVGDQIAVTGQKRHHHISRGHQIGLGDVVVSRGPLGAVAGHDVVRAVGSLHGTHGAHGDDVGIVGGRGDGSVALVAGGVVASLIAGGDYHHDSRLPRRFHGLAERVVSVTLEHLPSEREVDHPDVVGVLQLDGGLEGIDYLAVAARTVLIEDTQVDEVHIGGNAFDREPVIVAGGGGAIAADDAGHVGAMAVEVGGGVGAAGKILAIDDA